MSEVMESLRVLLHDKRILKNLSQSNVAKKMGYDSRTAYHMIEKGPTIINVAQLEALIPILEIKKEEVINVFFD
tara:strand:- start:126 stop:347 length:222 start_codon:yes stop_codon:yes gene_type:complete